MYYLLLFTSSETLKKQTEDILIPVLADSLTVEVTAYPEAPVSVLPEDLPSAILLDFITRPEQKENPWIQLLHCQYPYIPCLNYDGSASLKELLYSLKQNKDFSPFKGQYHIPYVQGIAFLQQLSSFNFIAPQSNINGPAYEIMSFVACIALLEETVSMTVLEKICYTLIKNYPFSFCYMNTSSRIFLFVLYEPTVNFVQLELNRQTLIDKVLENGSTLPPLKFGIIHHDLAGLVSSFLEASQVYYFNKLRTPCTFFEEISSPPGQLLKHQKLMEIERSIRTDIQFREGQNVLQYTRQWFAEYRNHHYSLNDMRYDLIILYASIKYVLFDMYNLKLKRIKSGLEVHEILSITTAEELENWFCTWLIYTLDNFDLTRSNTGFQLQKVLQFISNHIMDDLSLKTISSYFYVNPSYLSTLFKKKTGQTYISYVTKVKMGKACELLNANYKIYEVARMLGYEDIRYFRDTFKKYHGAPPSKFKLHPKPPA